MKKLLFIIFISSSLFFSCEEQNEDIVQDINKDGSIETIVTVKHEKNYDVLITTHKIWVSNILDKTIIDQDTIPSLGETTQEGEDENGNTELITVPKDYEFYITVN
jgi:hypothetical protein